MNKLMNQIKEHKNFLSFAIASIILIFSFILFHSRAHASSLVTYKLTYEDHFLNLKKDWYILENQKDNDAQAVMYKQSNVSMLSKQGGITIKVSRGQKIGQQYYYYSGRLSSNFSQKYGLFLFQATIPKGQHLWPALWTLGQYDPNKKWPFQGEIDVMETVDSVQMRSDFTSRLMARTTRYPNGTYYTSIPPDSSQLIKTFLTADQWKGTHIFAVDWYQIKGDVIFDFYLDVLPDASGKLAYIDGRKDIPTPIKHYSLNQMVSDAQKIKDPVPSMQTLNSEWTKNSFVIDIAVGGSWDQDQKSLNNGSWDPAKGPSAMTVNWVKCYVRSDQSPEPKNIS